MHKLELLAPAKNLECGLAAIDHGADAVYIGADKFGARAAAVNSLNDIKTLCDYAHQYGARIYVTVNTIIYEEEMDATQQLIFKLSEMGVDAILIQDMATLQMRKVAFDKIGSAPLLHASTQCDTRTPEKVEWLHKLGFSRAVLARELSLQEIREIHEAVPEMELEVFVHGALCVSYSGVCYASQHCFNRSANRGECAQFCRMKFDLLDADGKVIEEGRHFLSLKDMCQIDNLESLAAAGACSFKIEGRLKDVGYVKNVVSAYSREIDKLIAKHPDKYCRASYGSVDYNFHPSLSKTFNRGFTSYFLNGRQPDIASFDTPKALGEYVGTVKEMRRDSFNVSGTASFSNGDGLCFLNANHELEGFRVNRAVGNRLYPFKMPGMLKPNTKLYRNNDEAFNKILAGRTAERRIPIHMFFGLTATGFMLRLTFNANETEHDIAATSTITFEHQTAKKPQEDNIRKQLTKLGNTPFVCDHLEVDEQAAQMFVPSSLLSALRREATDALVSQIVDCHHREIQQEQKQTNADGLQAEAKVWQPEYQQFSYLYNVSNSGARDFYATHGLPHLGPAMEVEQDGKENILMQCRHCLRYSMGFCVRHGGRKPEWKEPLSLRLGDGRRFRLEFKCSECQMNVYSEK
ncbi:MAG: peptidase U32 family protein [Prevotella sp.]